jgi:hypothetical protein
MLSESLFPLSSGVVCIFHFLAMIAIADALGELVREFVETQSLSVSAVSTIVAVVLFFIFRTIILPVSEHGENNSISNAS